MKNERPVRLGILGCSDIARRRTLPAALKVPELTVTAVASRSEDNARAVAARFGGEAVVGYEALLESPDVDAVYVSLPTGLHHDWIVRALRAGKHVLAEKPLTARYPDTVTAVRLADSRGLTLMENLTFTQHSLHDAVREMLDEGGIGELRSLTSEFGFPPLPPGNVRYQPELAGGSLLDAGVYPLAAASMFLGPDLDVVGATLRMGTEAKVDVAGDALLCAPDGRTAHVSFGFEHAYRCAYTLWGSEGRIIVDRAFTPPPDFRPTVRLERADEVRERVLPADDQFAGTLACFVRAVTGGGSAAHSADVIARARLVSQVQGRARLLGNGWSGGADGR
ncbi:Gfo/Idh/MocA family protein [Streptomyces viridochromogenes]|uniref:Putative 3-ketoreductase n=1 Tax=Streptomyces viridochromogenes Tue57 TaxID=1160705 RepID=L8PEW9_STRVR|nr:Gfo/Idh/MocA family oxidoreductase [Streptomyces viridochromogenes]ELS56111.1 putative 3-ketoreductase [Streptomyces viridochromogenes Tue57]